MKAPTFRWKLAVLVAALVLGLAFPYVTGPYMVSIVTLALVFAIFALSINLLAGFGGLVTLGQAGIFGTAAYGVGYMAVRQDAGPLLQLGVGLLAGLAVTTLFALMAMRTTKVYFLMVTMAQGMIVWGIAYRSTTLGSENGLRGIARPEIVAPYWIYYYVVLAALVLSVLAMWTIGRSPLGLSLKGLRDSETRLRALGYNPALTRFYAFMLSGLLATIGGLLYVYYQQFVGPATPHFLTSGRGVLMVILGGVGTLTGPIVGAFLVIWIENIGSAYVARWLTVLGIVFIVTILFARNGIVGGLTNLWQRHLERAEPGSVRARVLTLGSPLDSVPSSASAGPALSGSEPASRDAQGAPVVASDEPQNPQNTKRK